VTAKTLQELSDGQGAKVYGGKEEYLPRISKHRENAGDPIVGRNKRGVQLERCRGKRGRLELPNIGIKVSGRKKRRDTAAVLTKD